MCTDSIPLHLLNTQPVQQSHLFYQVVPFSVYYTEDAIPKARQQLMNQDFIKCPPLSGKKIYHEHPSIPMQYSVKIFG